MKKKVFYRYNPHTLSYERVFPELKDRILVVLRHLSLSIAIAFGIFWIATYVIDSPREKELVKEIRLKDTQYKVLSQRMDDALAVLTDIQQRDDYMYRAIFHADAIPMSIRATGMGGVGRYEYLGKLNNSDLIIQTSKKMDLISKQIYVQSNSFDEVVGMAKKQKDRLQHIPSIMPISDKNLKRTASGYGNRIDPIYGTHKFHAGMDFSSNIGTPVFATGKGEVTHVGWKQGYGKCVVIDHGYDFETLFAHLNDYNVRVGQKVVRGEQIAEVGNTGKSTGPHLHYEVHVKGKADNPAKYYFMDLTPEQYDEMLQIAANHGQVMD